MKTYFLTSLGIAAHLLALNVQAVSAAESDAATAAENTADAQSWSRKLQKFAYQDYLFGDWGGWRTNLIQKGIDFEFLYVASLPWNLSGGIDTGASYQGALLMALDLSSDKLIGYHGGLFHAGGLWLHGSDHFSDEHIGDFNKVNLIDFPNGFRLWELWYDQRFFHDKVSVRFGQMVVD